MDTGLLLLGCGLSPISETLPHNGGHPLNPRGAQLGESADLGNSYQNSLHYGPRSKEPVGKEIPQRTVEQDEASLSSTFGRTISELPNTALAVCSASICKELSESLPLQLLEPILEEEGGTSSDSSGDDSQRSCSGSHGLKPQTHARATAKYRK